MQRSPKLAASVSVSVPQKVDAATALLTLMAAEGGGHKTVDGRVPNHSCMSLFRAGLVCVALLPRPRPRPHGPQVASRSEDYRCDFDYAAVSNRRDPLGSLWAFPSASILPTRGRAQCCVVPYFRICFGECLYLVALPTAYFFLSVSPIGAP